MLQWFILTIFDTIIYWDAYLYDKKYGRASIQRLSSSRLVKTSMMGYTTITFGRDDLYQYEDILETNESMNHCKLTFLLTDN